MITTHDALEIDNDAKGIIRTKWRKFPLRRIYFHVKLPKPFQVAESTHSGTFERLQEGYNISRIEKPMVQEDAESLFFNAELRAIKEGRRREIFSLSRKWSYCGGPWVCF